MQPDRAIAIDTERLRRTLGPAGLAFATTAEVDAGDGMSIQPPGSPAKALVHDLYSRAWRRARRSGQTEHTRRDR